MYINKSYIIEDYINNLDTPNNTNNDNSITDSLAETYVKRILDPLEENKPEDFFSCINEENSTNKIIPIDEPITITPEIIFDKDPTYNVYDTNYYEPILNVEENVEKSNKKNNYSLLFPIIILGGLLFSN